MKDVLNEALYILKEKQNKNINSYINEFIKNYAFSPTCKKKVRLTDKQKTAIIMVSMPPEISTQILKEFSREEIQEISSEIALLPNITSDIRNSVIEELLANSIDFEKNSWPCIDRVLLDHNAGDYRVYFNPQEKKLRVTIAKEWAINLVFINAREFLFHIISPTNKLAFSKNKMDHEYIIKFTAGFYSAVLVVFKEKLFFMVFDTRKFNIERDLLLVYSGNDLRLYVNRELPLQDVLTGKLIKEKKVNKEEILLSPGDNGKEVFMEEGKAKEAFSFEEEESDIQTDLDVQYSNDTNLWIERAIFLYKQGDYEGAVKCCDKALELDPTDMIAMTKKGLIFSVQRKFEESLWCYDKVLDIDPDDEEVMFYKVSVLTELDRYDESIFYCNRLLVKAPDNFEVQLLKAKSLFIKGRYEETIQFCNGALASKGEDVNLHFFKSICKGRDGKKYTEKENKKYLVESYEKYLKEITNKNMEESRRKFQKEEDEKIKRISIECGVSPEKGKKIHLIYTLCRLSPDEAKILLEENDYDERKTLQNMMKPDELKDRVIYVCRRTKVSEDEALKALEERYYDEIEAVMTIKKEQRMRKRKNEEKNKVSEKDIAKFNKKVKKILSIVKDNLKNFFLFLFSIKNNLTGKRNIEI